MSSSRNRRIALAALGGTVMAFALPTVFPIWGKTELLPGGQLGYLAHVAMIPLFIALEEASAAGGFGLGFTFGVVYFSVAIWWIDVAMHTFGGIPNYFAIPVLYLLIFTLAVFFGTATWLSRRARLRLGWPLWTTLPACWAALELVRNYIFSGYPWGDLGYTLARERLTAQWASLFGVYGLAFLVVLCNGALCELGKQWLEKRRFAPAPAAALAATLLLPLAWGSYRLGVIDREVASAPKLAVAIVQPNIDQKIKNAATGQMMSAAEYRSFILDRTMPLTEKADQDGAQLIAWPEASFPIDMPSHPTRLPSVGLPPLHAQLLVGGVTFGVSHGHRLLTNSAFAVGDDWRIEGQYDKHHLVPFGEYVPLEKTLHLPIHAVVPDIGFFDPGDELDVLKIDAGQRDIRIAPLICYDAIFPEIALDFAREDPDFLVNLTNDAWYGFSSASYQFLSIVTLRAIETGKALLRPANTGISAIIDPAGRVVAHTGIGLVDSPNDVVSAASAVPPELLEGKIPLLRNHTPYVVIGDTFAYLCAAFAALVFFLTRKAGAA